MLVLDAQDLTDDHEVQLELILVPLLDVVDTLIENQQRLLLANLGKTLEDP